jgi:hypothetical protein
MAGIAAALTVFNFARVLTVVIASADMCHEGAVKPGTRSGDWYQLWPEILHKIRRSQLYTTAKPATVIKVRTTTVASRG